MSSGRDWLVAAATTTTINRTFKASQSTKFNYEQRMNTTASIFQISSLTEHFATPFSVTFALSTTFLELSDGRSICFTVAPPLIELMDVERQ
jgi:hypothetical protein